MPAALAPTHPSVRALALDVESALASLEQRLDSRFEKVITLLESRTAAAASSRSSPHLEPRSHVLSYDPDTPPLSAPLRDSHLDDHLHNLHHLQHHHHHHLLPSAVLTPGSSVNGIVDEVVEVDKTMPIAIVGMGCRFPQEATSPDKLWDMLYNKQSARTEVPKDRFNAEAFYHPDGDRSGSMNLRGGHFLKEDIAAFDARFFSISPAEAKSMDPMQRILLEVVYEAMENAGISLADLDGSDTSCYVGCFTDDYDGLLKRDMELSPKYHSVGIVPAILSNRISFCFNLKGPSLTVDTACSSSLVAVHLACQSLRAGESRMAIVGATNALINPEVHVGMSNMHFLSPDATCFTFDARANGYARGEGMAALILKPLDDAIRDGDTIRAVIRGTAANQDGKTAGMTLPSREAQADLIHTAYEQAGCDPATTGYFEAHGTGTAAGDPIEASAIGATLGKFRPQGEEGKLYVGSIKTNIGHLEGASGLAGLIKAVMSLERGVILPNLWFEKGNPAIDFDGWRIRVPTEPTAWPTDGLRRASINSFGFGGTNCHTIIDDAYHYLQSRGLKGNHRTSPHPLHPIDRGTIGPPFLLKNLSNENDETHVTPQPTRPRIFNISSNEEELAITLSKSHAAHLASLTPTDSSDPTYLDNLAYTLCERRSTLPWTVAVVAHSTDELATKLADPSLKPTRRFAETPKLGFVFTGQGAQWWGMGRELLAYPVFADVLAKADDILRSFGAEWSLIDELCKSIDASRVNQAAISQPLCTAIQIALSDLLSSWGVHPLRVVGHSSGEIAAAYAIGALPLRSALQVAYFRGLHSARIASSGLNGAMMAAGVSEETATRYIAGLDKRLGKVVVACVNSPSSVTISGDESAISALLKWLEDEGLFARRLLVDTAYHSHHMQAIAADYRASLADLRVTPRGQRWPIDMISSVTRRSASDEDLDAEYWVRNMVSPVQFSAALEQLCTVETKGKKGKRRANKSAVNILVELGPHSALAGPIKQILAASKTLKAAGISYQPSLLRNQDAAGTMLSLAATLSASGCTIDIHTANFPHPSPTPLAVLPSLPSYAWNHSTRYWSESRLSSDYRFRAFPRTDVLGAQSTDWNPTEPTWRNFVRLGELPWVKHHQVQDTVIYPAAGYVCMALEAAAQMLALAPASFLAGRKVQGYTIRDLTISRALVVPQSEEGVETVFSMRPYADSSVASSATWREFRVFSYLPESGWAEHCRGIIAVELDCVASEVAATSEADAAVEESRERLRHAEQVCKVKGDSDALYEALASAGLWYGPSFRLITSIATGAGQALGRVRVPDTKSLMPMEFEYESLVHPATLDGFIQMIIPALSQGDTNSVHEPFVPTFIEELRFAASIPARAGHEFRACAEARFKGFREAVARITVFDGDEVPVVSIRGMKCTALSAPGGGARQAVVRKHCGTAVWEPDVDLLSELQALRVLRGAALRVSPQVLTTSPAPRREDVEVLAWSFCEAMLREVDVAAVVPERRALYEFIEKQRELVRVGEMEDQTPEWEMLDDPQTQVRITRLIDEFSHGENAECRLLVRMGQALPAILKGEIDPEPLLREEDLLSTYYATGLGIPQAYIALQRYLTVLSHKYPDLEYLEVGSGTGNATSHVLDALNGYNKHRYPKLKSYTYTDASDTTFAAATDTFRTWGNLFSCRTLDVTRDPATQGFEGKTYDVIIAANALHAAPSIDDALAHVRALLKPGGKLILVETTNLHLSAALILAPQYRSWFTASEAAGPLQEHQWEDVMSRHGFGGLEASVPDVLDPLAHATSVLVATALKPEAMSTGLALPLSLHVVLVQPEGGSSAAAELVGATRKALGGHGIGVEVVEFGELATTQLKGKICICLAELDTSILAEVSLRDFEQLQRLTSEPVGLLWITRGSTATKSTKPELSIFQGLARSLRAEREGFPCVTVDLDADYRLPAEQVVDLLFGVFQQTFVRGKAAAVNDREFAERNGILHIKRMVEDAEFNKYIAVRTGAAPLRPRPEKLVQPARPLKLALDAIGSLDSFYFDDDTSVAEPLAAGEVEVSVRAVGLNFRDILIALGEMSDNYLGNECAGVVTRVGSGVEHVGVGDRVAVWCLGCFSTLMRNPADTVQRIPDDMSFADAAGFPIIYVTAYYSLVHLARLRQRESVLIHAAAGGVGQAAIQIAQRVGAEVYVTVGTAEKKAHIMSRFGIPEDHIFSSRDVSFEAGIARMTGGRGVDVVLNSLAGELLKATWRSIAPFGRFVELGKRDIEANAKLDMAPFVRNVVFASVDITAMLRLNRALGAEMFAAAMEMVRKGEVGAASPITVFPFREVGEAFRHMQAGRHMGKIVLEPREEDVVQVMPRPPKGVKFHSDASYLLAGGLGGIGRSISKWMVSNGARNLIFVSRSGVSSDAARDLIHTLKSAGVRVEVLQCDLTDEVKFFGLLRTALQSMPPIRGVIQGAMVLKDQIFANMPYETFVNTLRPKVQGSWSLHQATLDQPLDFFVLLSSASSFLGNAGQSNYVAACTYQVSLAAHRLSLGLPATAIDIGKVASVGVVAESKDTTIEANLVRIGLRDIQESELHAIIELAMLPNPQGVTNGHLITGAHTSLDTSADAAADLPFWSRDPVFSHLDVLRPHLLAPSGASGARQPLKSLLSSATSRADAVSVVLEALRGKLARALAMPVVEIDAARSTAAYGIDSLLAVDIRNWIFREGGADVAVFEVLQARSVAGLAARVVEGSKFVGVGVKNEES